MWPTYRPRPVKTVVGQPVPLLMSRLWMSRRVKVARGLAAGALSLWKGWAKYHYRPKKSNNAARLAENHRPSCRKPSVSVGQGPPKRYTDGMKCTPADAQPVYPWRNGPRGQPRFLTNVWLLAQYACRPPLELPETHRCPNPQSSPYHEGLRLARWCRRSCVGGGQPECQAVQGLWPRCFLCIRQW